MFCSDKEDTALNRYFQKNPMISLSPLEWQNYCIHQRKPHTGEILSMVCISDMVKPNKGKLLLVWCQIKQGCERQLRGDTLTQLNVLHDLNQQCSGSMLKGTRALKPLSHAACMASIILKSPLFCRQVSWQSQASYPSLLHLLTLPSHSLPDLTPYTLALEPHSSPALWQEEVEQEKDAAREQM